MKTIKEPTQQNVIVTQLRQFSELCSGRQKMFYEQQLRDVHKVQCVSIHDVFDATEIYRIKRYVKPEPRMCYRNAHLLTALFPDRVQYIEGYVAIFNGGWGIEHAWNKVGDVYVDVTFEMALNEDPTKELYMALGTYNLATITEVTSETGYYGSIYNHRIINILKNNKQ